MDYYAIGQRIRKARKARGLSQEELATMTGISTTHMSHIETGNTKLSLPVMVDLAAALDTHTDDLLFGQGPARHGAAADAIDALLDGCTPQQLAIIRDVVKALKISLSQHS